MGMEDQVDLLVDEQVEELLIDPAVVDAHAEAVLVHPDDDPREPGGTSSIDDCPQPPVVRVVLAVVEVLAADGEVWRDHDHPGQTRNVEVVLRPVVAGGIRTIGQTLGEVRELAISSRIVFVISRYELDRDMTDPRFHHPAPALLAARAGVAEVTEAENDVRPRPTHRPKRRLGV